MRQNAIFRHDYGQMTTDNFEKRIAAGEFKAKCLRLLDEVAQHRAPLVITKRGKPVARLVPIDDKPVDLYGRMKGTARILGDIVSPLDDLEWSGDAENIFGDDGKKP
jgi:prevent-host-death family protein